MDVLRCLKSLSSEELAAWLAAHGQPAYRGRQIHEWLYRHWIVSFDEMLNLPKALRQELAAEFRPYTLTLAERLDAADGTRKFRFTLGDGESIETVLIPAEARHTVCISTQVGCPVRCAFCASGSAGPFRNLEPAEIVDQAVWACRELRTRVSNIVVMGMGEPLLNLDNLLPALERVCSPEGLGVGARHVTVSTSGIVPGILRLAELGRQWELAISLHATTDANRARLIPDRYRYPIAEILDACDVYRDRTGRMPTFEYVLLADVNDSPQEMAALADLARTHRAKINLIACNPGSSRYRAPTAATVKRCLQDLARNRARATLRQSKGEDIRAACGQLRQQRHGADESSAT
jgi:23S rRNA (adenine2503-C2)-methyltransferase